METKEQDRATADGFEHSVEARDDERQQLAADLDAFLNGGGEIQEVPKDFRADPPKKPQNNYGRGSL